MLRPLFILAIVICYASNVKTKILTSSNETPGTDVCTCMPDYLCLNFTHNGQQSNTIDILHDDVPCTQFIHKIVCCEKRPMVNKPIVPTTPEMFETTPSSVSTCGYTHANNKMDNDVPGFPWMVAVIFITTDFEKQKSIFKGGGSLINDRVVLTAAHIVNTNNTYKIRAGEYDFTRKDERYPYQDRKVFSIVLHPYFDKRDLRNDIALLFLEKPVDVAPNVNFICLPPEWKVFEYTRCLVGGWGKTSLKANSKYSKTLQVVEMPIVENAKCVKKLRNTTLGKRFQLHESFVCAGGELYDTAEGDGGGPLVCPIVDDTRSIFYQAGIVAWGINSGRRVNPGVYANVAMFRKWIDQQMSVHNLNSKSYEYDPTNTTLY